jgi:hypothetical protein
MLVSADPFGSGLTLLSNYFLFVISNGRRPERS